MPEGLFWTEQEDQVLVRLWETTAAKEIGALVGKTKNAVIGKANRLGLPHKKAAPKMKQHREPTQKRPSRARMPVIRKQPMAIVPEAPVNGGGLHIMELKQHHCREVVGYGYPDLLARYCGHPKKTGSSFCPGHHAKNYQDPLASSTQR